MLKYRLLAIIYDVKYMLFPVKIKRYLIYKNVDFALFISIRKIILTTNNAINYTNACRTCVNIYGVSSEK